MTQPDPNEVDEQGKRHGDKLQEAFGHDAEKGGQPDPDEEREAVGP
jgi:hypothetical protein